MYPANITREEAARRARQIRSHSYQVSVDLTGTADVPGGYDATATFWSRSAVRFASTGGASHLDLIADRVLSATLDGVLLPAEAFNDHRVAFEAAAGEHELVVTALCRYSRTGEGLHRFVDPVDDLVYCYTQLETADARRLFACFEQPDLKATFALDVRADASWTVLSNSPEVAPVDLGDGTAHWTFAPTPPISTYITALIAGHFHVVRDAHQGKAAEIPLSLACRRSLVDYLDTDRLLATTKAGFEVFEEHFGMPYPFADYAQVFVPEFNAGAMENAGCVTIRDEYLYRSRVTQASYETRDNTILHELAHMWFGDLVTMTWWDDLWLNESFAEFASHFCQAEIRNKTGVGDDPWSTFTNARKNWAYRQDQLPSTHPVAADMVDLEAVELNFDGITYAKGASVLRQLVAFVGQDAFLAGVRAYFAKHAWGNTQLCDLLNALTEASGRDLSFFAAEWLQVAGVNTLRAEFEVDAEGRFTRFALRQTAPDQWPTLRHHRLAIGLYDLVDGRLVRRDRVEVDIAGELTELPELIGRARGTLVLPNDDDLTYAKLRLDPESLAALVASMGTIDSALTRALCWAAAWDMCRDAELPSHDFVALVLAGVGVETDLTAVGSVLAQARTAIDYFTPEADRGELNEFFVDGLSRLLAEAEPESDHQLALARALATSAESSATAAVLNTWLDGSAVPSGLAVDTDLRWHLITNLARLGAIGATEIEAELALDPTAQGAERAAGARAALPSAEAKIQAWRLATADDDVPNETHYQITSNFWQFGADAVLKPYLGAYREVAEAISAGRDGWADRSSALRQHVLGLLFPRTLMDRTALAELDAWLESVSLTDAVARQVLERRDDAERALRCQEAFS
ncbi:membrane alanyl aminopeptidase [Propionicimonas paludicola]|uniref:Aminopeptidase N n=1 Tax=Propionicimonas paludicola TaxID=185243 RepID=A0A2A9CNS3_9ACTN|nr:aminopeptidase N [Propionicimonas paludicola]PFG16043.1 membrane alanyl aminopeptidase [Propionicimonas paludicola]